MAQLYQYPWRSKLQPASFRGATFHVETDGISSGRRIALHEYPKRNTPYAEDMGKLAQRHTVEGYMIMSPSKLDFTGDRDALIKALEADGPATLIHPSMGTMQVMAGPYTVNETREKGGMCTFHMTFIEAGSAGSSGSGDTQSGVNSAASALEQ
jgi:prophage DNA circulation protein